jgi:hypothetical protein
MEFHKDSPMEFGAGEEAEAARGREKQTREEINHRNRLH